MGFYARYILPWMIDKVMTGDVVEADRAIIVPRASGEVLELGMGSGHNLDFYGPDVKALRAVEPSAELAAMARKRTGEVAFPVEIAEVSAETMPFDNNSFDSAVVTWALCSIPDMSAALAEVRRVLKPAGALHFVEHGLAPEAAVARWQNRLNPLWRPFSGGCNMNRPMDTAIKAAGFRIDDADNGYVEGPRILSYTYRGCARPR
ncbi:MAG: class I SAM-dependent methyltransferase [Pseudomonadota bacterium]